MFIIRFFIFALLLYVAWRVICNKVLKKRSRVNEQNDSSRLQDILVEDPVCHVLVPKHEALRLRKDGVTYYFCSEQCCDQFSRESEKGVK